MGSLLIREQKTIGVRKGSLIIKPLMRKSAISKAGKFLETMMDDTTIETHQQMSMENIDEIFVIDTEVKLSSATLNEFSKRIIPIYWIEKGKVTRKLTPVPAHGSVKSRVAQEKSPAKLENFRPIVKKTLAGLRKQLRIKTRPIYHKMEKFMQTPEVFPFLRQLKAFLLTAPDPNSALDEFLTMSDRPPPKKLQEISAGYYSNQLRLLLESMLQCIVGFETTIAGLLPRGNGYLYPTLLESMMVELETEYIDLILHKFQTEQNALQAFFHQIQGRKLRRKVQVATTTYAQHCLNQQELKNPLFKR